MIEQTQQKLLEIARDVLDLEDQFDHQQDARSQGERLIALDSLKEHTRTLYEAIVVLRHELSLAQESQDALADNNQTQEDMATFEPTLVSDQELDFELAPSRDDTPDFEPSTEKIKDIVAQMPVETQQVDALFDSITDGSPEAYEALSHYQEDIEFEPVPEASTSEPAPDSGPAPVSEPDTDSESIPVSESAPKSDVKSSTDSEPASVSEPASGLNATIQKPKSVNDQWGRLSIGLNDRTAFVQHLFLGDIEGFNRVISQISTFESLEEVGEFLENQVKPEYNNWETKEAVADRFMRLIQQRFNA
jgi:hypothetical protein